jgi:hypothetical protein
METRYPAPRRDVPGRPPLKLQKEIHVPVSAHYASNYRGVGRTVTSPFVLPP